MARPINRLTVVEVRTAEPGRYTDGGGLGVHPFSGPGVMRSFEFL